MFFLLKKFLSLFKRNKMITDAILTNFQTEINKIKTLLNNEYSPLKGDPKYEDIYRSYTLLSMSIISAFENIEQLKIKKFSDT